MSIFTSLEASAKADLAGVESFLEDLVAADFKAVFPIAQTEVASLVAAETVAVASGDTKNTGTILAAAVKNTEASVIAAGITTTSSTILAAVGAALPKAQ